MYLRNKVRCRGCSSSQKTSVADASSFATLIPAPENPGRALALSSKKGTTTPAVALLWFMGIASLQGRSRHLQPEV
jgi:hypothetical protein